MIGGTTSGTPSSTSSVSLVLVIASMTSPPISSSRLRTAIDAPEPITVSQHRRVVGEPRDDLAGARQLEELRREPQQVVEDVAAQVGRHALAQQRHEVEAGVGGGRHHDDDRQHRGQRAVQLGAVAGAEAVVDHRAQPLPHREHRARRDQQRDGRVRDLPPVRPQVGADARERPQGGDRRRRREWFGRHGVGARGRGSAEDGCGRLRDAAGHVSLWPGRCRDRGGQPPASGAPPAVHPLRRPRCLPPCPR